jgi:tetratricopeptide (TPR) repeat protein
MRIILLHVVLAITASFISCEQKGDKKNRDLSEMLPRKKALTYTAEWAMIQNNAAVLTKNLRSNPSDKKSLLAMIALYLQEARNTGNFSYYNEAALNCIDRVLEIDAVNFEARSFKATILLSQHQFEQALEIAENLQKQYPLNAYVYGLLVDALVELGRYEDAVVAAEQMISIRPDIRSYARISYLREIHGDLDGAVAAMKLAVDAGVPGDENTEWCRVRLGHLYEQLGKVSDANLHYSIANENRQPYPYALAGMARIEAHNRDYKTALNLYQGADSLLTDHGFKEGIAEMQEMLGRKEMADKIAKDILNYMKAIAGNSEASLGQNEDHEMAHALMGVGDYQQALEYVLKEYRRRPANIEVNETVALVYYQQGLYQQAIPFMEKAMSTGCRNPELLCHAGLLFVKSGNTGKGKQLIREALKNNPVISHGLLEECKTILGM